MGRLVDSHRKPKRFAPSAKPGPAAGRRPAKSKSDESDWREEALARIRRIVERAVPDVVEEVKWRKPSNGMKGVPVWSCGGILCTGERYKGCVKLTFVKGAALPDPGGLFNSSLDGNTRRAIDIAGGERIDERKLAALFRAAAEHNLSSGAGRRSRTTATRRSAGVPKRSPKKAVLLSGGNPQIAKADGDGALQAYIAAIPGWKQDVGRRLDAAITAAVPGVRKAVKWNSPFYGVEGRGWFIGFHCFAKYVKVTFFRGASLRPLPPGESKSKEVRYLDIREADRVDESLLRSWIRQAAAMPGWGS